MTDLDKYRKRTDKPHLCLIYTSFPDIGYLNPGGWALNFTNADIVDNITEEIEDFILGVNPDYYKDKATAAITWHYCQRVEQ